jgi:uncharacterized damage-inducible protein DinB
MKTERTQSSTLEKLRYPTGRLQYSGPMTVQQRQDLIERIKTFPVRLRALADALPEAALDQPYRPEGWTARQVIHHLVDSHLNAYIRFKLALTEETPTIKPYDESAWARLPDTSHTPIDVSVALLESLHARWSVLLEHLSPEDWQRSVFHPEQRRPITLDEFLALYAWHGDHHLAHIRLIDY